MNRTYTTYTSHNAPSVLDHALTVGADLHLKLEKKTHRQAHDSVPAACYFHARNC
jgi:hypothetical protein